MSSSLGILVWQSDVHGVGCELCLACRQFRIGTSGVSFLRLVPSGWGAGAHRALRRVGEI